MRNSVAFSHQEVGFSTELINGLYQFFAPASQFNNCYESIEAIS